MASEKYEYMSSYSQALDLQLEELRSLKEGRLLTKNEADYAHKKEVEQCEGEIGDLKAQLNDVRKALQERRSKVAVELSNKVKKSAATNKNILSHQLNPFLNLPFIISKKTKNSQSKGQYSKTGTEEAFSEYEMVFQKLHDSHMQKMRSLTQQFEKKSLQKDADFDKVISNCEFLLSEKK